MITTTIRINDNSRTAIRIIITCEEKFVKPENVKQGAKVLL